MSEEYGQEGEMAPDAQNKKKQSLTYLFDSCYPKIYRYMYLRLRHPEMAEDLTSDVMLRVVRSLRSYHHRGVPIEAWVYRIAANRLRDHLRKARGKQTARLNEALVRRQVFCKLGGHVLPHELHHHQLTDLLLGGEGFKDSVNKVIVPFAEIFSPCIALTKEKESGQENYSQRLSLHAGDYTALVAILNT